MAKKNKIKEFKPTKWLYVVIFMFPLILTLIYNNKLDNDIWYLLAEGRYIVQHGLYHIDPLTFHEGLQITVQNWVSASGLWLTYKTFGEMGILFIVLLCNFFISLLVYKISKLISDNNRVLALMITFVCNVTLTSHYMVSRPQVLSYVVLLSVIYVLELYIKSGNWKYLIWLPILSLIQVNMHASLWWMIFLFALPYVIDSFKIPFLKTQGYNKKMLFIFLGIALLVGLINPYGFRAISFIFTSYGDKYMHLYINELLPYSFNTNLGKHMFILILLFTMVYAFFREGNIRVRYLCLFAGTLLLSFMSVKGFSNFILVAFFPMAYFFKDIIPKDYSDLGFAKKIICSLLIVLSCIEFIFFGYLLIKAPDKLELKHNAEEAMDVVEATWDPKDVRIYSSFNNGGYVELRGFKPYIDQRGEVFLKANNKKYDLFEEYYNLQHNKLDFQEFVDKYKFTHLLVQNVDKLYYQMENVTGYVLIYENSDKGYRVFASEELFTDSQLKDIKEHYKNKIEQLEKESKEK